jgi:hypothetical protein
VPVSMTVTVLLVVCLLFTHIRFPCSSQIMVWVTGQGLVRPRGEQP